eukprot:3676344-Rhodomonas_salina.2
MWDAALQSRARGSADAWLFLAVCGTEIANGSPNCKVVTAADSIQVSAYEFRYLPTSSAIYLRAR